jgi:hypothetical protein
MVTLVSSLYVACGGTGIGTGLTVHFRWTALGATAPLATPATMNKARSAPATPADLTRQG